MNAATVAREIEVQDLGDRYVVQIRGRRREFTDDARDCSKRVRVAAVFVALTVAPPDIGLPDLSPEPSPEPPRAPPSQLAPPAPATPDEVRRSWWPELELGALAGMAPRSDTSLFFMGGELRAALVSERWGFTLGASAPTASTIVLTNVRVRLARYPLDVGVRLRFVGPAVGAWFDLGATAALVSVRGLDLADASTVSRVEAGARAAATLAAQGAVAPYLRVFSEFVPVPYEVAVEPRGPLGRIPRVWAGFAAGVTAKFP